MPLVYYPSILILMTLTTLTSDVFAHGFLSSAFSEYFVAYTAAHKRCEISHECVKVARNWWSDSFL